MNGKVTNADIEIGRKVMWRWLDNPGSGLPFQIARAIADERHRILNTDEGRAALELVARALALIEDKQ